MRIAGLTREAHSVSEKKGSSSQWCWCLHLSKRKNRKTTSLDAEKSRLLLTEESATKFIFRFRKIKYYMGVFDCSGCHLREKRQRLTKISAGIADVTDLLCTALEKDSKHSWILSIPKVLTLLSSKRDTTLSPTFPTADLKVFPWNTEKSQKLHLVPPWILNISLVYTQILSLDSKIVMCHSDVPEKADCCSSWGWGVLRGCCRETEENEGLSAVFAEEQGPTPASQSPGEQTGTTLPSKMCPGKCWVCYLLCVH